MTTLKLLVILCSKYKISLFKQLFEISLQLWVKEKQMPKDESWCAGCETVATE